MQFDIEVATVDAGSDAGGDDGPVLVMRLSGDLDVASAPQLRQMLVRTVAESEGSPLVVVDLGGIDFLDSTGLGVLLGAVKRVRGQGGELALCRAEPQVRKVFEITHVIEILPIHHDVSSAVASVRGASATR